MYDRMRQGWRSGGIATAGIAQCWGLAGLDAVGDGTKGGAPTRYSRALGQPCSHLLRGPLGQTSESPGDPAGRTTFGT